MSFHVIAIDDGQHEPATRLPEAAAQLADEVHAAVDALAELDSDAPPDAVLAAFAKWSRSPIGRAEGDLLLLVHECGVSVRALVEVTGMSDRTVRDRISWARADRVHEDADADADADSTPPWPSDGEFIMARGVGVREEDH